MKAHHAHVLTVIGSAGQVGLAYAALVQSNPVAFVWFNAITWLGTVLSLLMSVVFFIPKEVRKKLLRDVRSRMPVWRKHLAVLTDVVTIALALNFNAPWVATAYLIQLAVFFGIFFHDDDDEGHRKPKRAPMVIEGA